MRGLINIAAPLSEKLLSPVRQELMHKGFTRWPVPILSSETCDHLHEAMNRCFRGEFSTKIYPDEWHWREGISSPSAVREICNAWKSDHDVAKIVTSPEIGSLVCALTGWKTARVGQDDLVWKPPQCGGVGYHRDADYISCQFKGSAESAINKESSK
eukprot:GEMP01041848.1.p2 GENE.GEMP01041848.1~~GEMP01041848.1.p2  ORF type:complete len:157 (+),score=27.14 GEMP01041848.1:55-525(+)